MAQYCASGVNMAQCCASGINVAVHHASIWLNAVQALIYGPVMCIRHCNEAQTLYYISAGVHILCAPGISKARCGASMTQTVHHASIWVNTTCLIALNLPHHTLSTSFFCG